MPYQIIVQVAQNFHKRQYFQWFRKHDVQSVIAHQWIRWKKSSYLGKKKSVVHRLQIKSKSFVFINALENWIFLMWSIDLNCNFQNQIPRLVVNSGGDRQFTDAKLQKAEINLQSAENSKNIQFVFLFNRLVDCLFLVRGENGSTWFYSLGIMRHGFAWNTFGEKV